MWIGINAFKAESKGGRLIINLYFVDSIFIT